MNSKNVVSHIVEWLKDYQKESATKGFVVGVSGGIDSAVTASLCAKTGLPLICVEMPIHQSKIQVKRASGQIELLMSYCNHVGRQKIDLTGVFDSMLRDLPKFDNNELSLVNTRARLRMTALYYVAGSKSMLVVGTGNKVEDFGVGFFTKYGDGGVDLSPIADLNKTEVYSLGKELGVIDAIMKAPPTDGLWGDERTDEDQIGASYPELEWAMGIVASNKLPLNLTARQREVIEIYSRLHIVNQHKIMPIPVCKVSQKLKFG